MYGPKTVLLYLVVPGQSGSAATACGSRASAGPASPAGPSRASASPLGDEPDILVCLPVDDEGVP